RTRSVGGRLRPHLSATRRAAHRPARDPQRAPGRPPRLRDRVSPRRRGRALVGALRRTRLSAGPRAADRGPRRRHAARHLAVPGGGPPAPADRHDPAQRLLLRQRSHLRGPRAAGLGALARARDRRGRGGGARLRALRRLAADGIAVRAAARLARDPARGRRSHRLLRARRRGSGGGRGADQAPARGARRRRGGAGLPAPAPGRGRRRPARGAHHARGRAHLDRSGDRGERALRERARARGRRPVRARGSARPRRPVIGRPLYSADNEDTRSELRALAPAPDDTIVCVAAGGGRALSLLGGGGGRLLAVDRRPEQLHVLELKAAALDGLSYRALRAFLGVDPSPDRLDAWGSLRGALSPAARRYWEARPTLIRDGVLYAGRLEAWLARTAAWGRRAGWLRWPDACFAATDLAAQRAVLLSRAAEVAGAERGFALLMHPAVAWLAMRDPSFLRSSEG